MKIIFAEKLSLENSFNGSSPNFASTAPQQTIVGSQGEWKFFNTLEFT